MEGQPIETAPKDGRTILVWQPPAAGQPPSDDDFSLVKWWAYTSSPGGEWALAECGTYASDAVPMNSSPALWWALPSPSAANLS